MRIRPSRSGSFHQRSIYGVEQLIAEVLTCVPRSASGAFSALESGCITAGSWLSYLIVLSLSVQFHAKNPAWGDGLILALAVLTAMFFPFPAVARVGSFIGSEVAGNSGSGDHFVCAWRSFADRDGARQAPKQEFWTAIVGPLTSAGIGLFCLALSGVAGASYQPGHGDGFVARLHQFNPGCV